MNAPHEIANHVTVANEILAQLGGGRFIAMTGARLFCASPDQRGALSFRIPGNLTRNGINHVKITLNFLDEYDVEFSTVRGLKQIIKASESGVYFDTLQSTFTRITRLETRL